MKKKIRTLLALLVTVASILATVIFRIIETDYFQLTDNFWSVLPQIVTITMMFITKEVYSSLFLGIVIGSILQCQNISFNKVVDETVLSFFPTPYYSMIGLLLFLVLLGIIAALVNKACISAIFGRWAETHIKTRIGAQFTILILSVFTFIDDHFYYHNTGSVIKSIADRHGVSRAKLSYLINATAAMVCMLVVAGSLTTTNVHNVIHNEAFYFQTSGIELFVKVLGYNFYLLLTFSFIIILVLSKRDFGPMALHEKKAIETSDLLSIEENTESPEVKSSSKNRIQDFLLPFLFIIGACVYALIRYNNMLDPSPFFYDTIDTLSTWKHSVLPQSVLFALILIAVYLIVRKLITFQDAMNCIPMGFTAMVPTLIVLVLINSINANAAQLSATYYIHGLINNELKVFIGFLPAIIFLVACLLSYTTGNSFATFGILFPIADAAFSEHNPMFVIAVSACLAGSLCGGHCSSISKTSVMPSASAGCLHASHISAQMPYTIIVATISFICFLVAGFVHNTFLCLGLGILLIFGFFALLRHFQKTSA